MPLCPAPASTSKPLGAKNSSRRLRQASPRVPSSSDASPVVCTKGTRNENALNGVGESKTGDARASRLPRSAAGKRTGLFPVRHGGARRHVRRPGPEPDRIDDTVLRDCIEDRGAKTLVNVCSYPVNVRWCAAGSTVCGRSSCAQSVAMRIEPYGGYQARALGDEIRWVACRAPESALNSYDGTITTWSCGLDPRVERYRQKFAEAAAARSPRTPPTVESARKEPDLPASPDEQPRTTGIRQDERGAEIPAVDPLLSVVSAKC